MVKRSISIVLPVMLVTGGILASASSAVAFPSNMITVNSEAPNWDVTFNCGVSGSDNLRIPYTEGATLTVHMAGCQQKIWAFPDDDTLTATYPAGVTLSDGTHMSSPIENFLTSTTFVTVDPNTSFSTITPPGENRAVSFVPVDEILENPAGSLLETRTLTIPTDADTFEAGIPLAPNNPLNGDVDCEVQPGEHVYGSESIVITEEGDYTFRVVATYPNTTPGFTGRVDNSIEMNGLALYSSFDASANGDNVLACQVNGGVNTGAMYLTGTKTGHSVSAFYSTMSATLKPGTYTLVGFTNDAWSAADWSTGQQNGGTPIDESMSVEIWGDPAATLPNTGVDATLNGMIATAVIALIALGGLLLAVRTRRN